MNTLRLVRSLFLLVCVAEHVAGFAPPLQLPSSTCTTLSSVRLHETSENAAAASDGSSSNTESRLENDDRTKLEAFLEKKYPSFYKLLINDGMAKAIREGSATIFAPNEAAFTALGERKLSQIEDPRNLEIREKMGSYHVIAGESISAMALKTEDWTKGKPKDGSPPNTLISGFKTLSGEVPVGRSKSGGILGWGAKEDGDIVIGPEAKIVQSFNVEGSFVHEVDALISPLILWRYCDQLRIPGF